MARLSLTLLGGFQARRDPGGASSLPTKKAQDLLAYLAMPVGRAHPRDKLAAVLWGGIREESARNSLRQAIFALQKALTAADPPSLRLDGDLVALDPAAVDVDVVAFERAAAEATPAALERAAALYQGDFSPGWPWTRRRSRSGCSASESACASWRWRGWRSSSLISARRGRQRRRSRRRSSC
jgi:DNA-binding SARP family transcriptional activator